MTLKIFLVGSKSKRVCSLTPAATLTIFMSSLIWSAMLEHSSGISCGLTHKNKISELLRHSSSSIAAWPLSLNQFRFVSKISYPDIWYSELFSRPDMSDFARWPQPINPIFFNLILFGLFVHHYFYLNFLSVFSIDVN